MKMENNADMKNINGVVQETESLLSGLQVNSIAPSRMTKLYSRAIRILIYLGLAGGLALIGCGEKGTDASAIHELVKVRVEIARALDGQGFERVPGNIRSAQESQLEAKFPAKIMKVLVKEGERVREGQSLAELDRKEIQAKLDQALAAQLQAKQDIERFTKLLPAGAVTKQEFDAADARKKIADAAVNEAKAFVEYTTISAPYDGIVTKKQLQDGDLAAPGKPLLSMEREDLYRFEADIPETLNSRINLGGSLLLTLTGVDDPVKGVISEVSPVMDPNSRTFHIKIDVPKGVVVRSGQFGYVSLPTKENRAVAISCAAVHERGQLEYIFVVEGQAALLRLIRLGKRNDNLCEVLSGVNEGEQIVLSSEQKLTDGQMVEVSK